MARKGFDGDIIGFKEVIIDDPNLASNNSTSFTRAFGSTKDFVRGSASQFPFAPGGLDSQVIIEQDLDNDVDLDIDIDFFDFEGRDSNIIAPGLDRGLAFEDDDNEKGNDTNTVANKDSVFNIEDMMAPVDSTFDFLNVKVAPVDHVAEDITEDDDNSKGISCIMEFISIYIYILTSFYILRFSTRSG